MKVYISGKITGLPENIYRAVFAEARESVIRQGHTPVCPVTDVDHRHEDKSWEGYMRRNIRALTECHAILMLHNWTDSRGAKVELEIARHLGLLVVYHQVEAMPYS